MYDCAEEEIEAIAKIIRSKKLFRYQGNDIETECFKFEKNFAHYLGVHQTILLSSGTNAIVNALYCAGVKAKDEVLVPAYTFFATFAAIIEIGAIPIAINIDESLNFDLNDLKKNITEKTTAIIAVHMDGYPQNLAELVNISKEHNLTLIEDVAQAVGGSYKGQKLGSIGDFGCFSFNMDKIITCGEGGALSVKNEEHYQKAMLYHDTCNQFGPTLKAKYTIDKFVGKSMRVSEIQGAMINVQLSKLDPIIAKLKIRKIDIDQKLLDLGISLIPSLDSKGECATTSRFFAKNPEEAQKLMIKINQLGLKSQVPTIRPAHNIWQFIHLLPKESRANKLSFLDTIEKLSKTVLVYTDIQTAPESWNKKLELLKTL